MANTQPCITCLGTGLVLESDRHRHEGQYGGRPYAVESRTLGICGCTAGDRALRRLRQLVAEQVATEQTTDATPRG